MSPGALGGCVYSSVLPFVVDFFFVVVWECMVEVIITVVVFMVTMVTTT